jgi:hypothetical protein
MFQPKLFENSQVGFGLSLACLAHSLKYFFHPTFFLDLPKVFNVLYSLVPVHFYIPITLKLGIKELKNKEQTGFKELFTDYQPIP